jgi:hypothetical protein
MMLNKFFLLFLSLCFSGCVFLQPKDPAGVYEMNVIEWQERIKKEGWSKRMVDEITAQCASIAAFRFEETDYWMTPREFIEAGFKGDCEDIAIFQMGTLKRLGYPHRVRIRIVKTLTGHHAICRVELPNGKWKSYESVRMPLYQIDALFYRTILDFDEKGIYPAGSET